MEVVKAAKFAELPPPEMESLTDRDARVWYLHQESRIAKEVAEIDGLQGAATEAFELRNDIRSKARKLMLDQDKARMLHSTDPHMTFKGLVARKAAKGIQAEDDIYMSIIDSASKSRAAVNKELVVEP